MPPKRGNDPRQAEMRKLLLRRNRLNQQIRILYQQVRLIDQQIAEVHLFLRRRSRAD